MKFFQRTHIRDTQAETALFSRRVWFAMVVVVAVFGVLVMNMYTLQVKQFESFQTRSNDNRIKVVPIPPNRGLIYDRKGRLLAENRPVMSLEITPERVTDLDDTLQRLQTILNLSNEQIADFHTARKREQRFRQVILLDNLDEEQVAKFAVRQHDFPGVSLEARLVRYYPYGESLTHALGYVAKINERDVNKLQERGVSANYAATRTIGKLGIERFYEEQLHGTVGYRQVEVDIHGRMLRTLSIEPPVPGQDLYLELDVEMQQYAYEVLGPRRGSIIVMNPQTGGVLAMVSKPSYDPNWFARGISYTQYQGLLQSKHSPLLNRSTQGGYPPASTIKPQLAVLGLEAGIITPTTTIQDPGWFQIKGVDHRYRDWLRWGHGEVNVTEAIVESCDTFYYDLALKLGMDRISPFMQQFGFGEYTGIDIHEESSAVMPSRGWKRARFNQPWYAGETVSIGIGQSYWTATPMQLAVATTTLINRGQGRVPRLLAELADGEIRLPAVQEQREPIILNNPANWDVAIEAMNDVVDAVRGTAHTAFRGADYSSGGKTGTAQVINIAQGEEYNADEIEERFRDNAMYVGYAPQDNPEIVVVFTVENAGGGGSIAAPKARELMDFYFNQVKADANN